MYHIIYTIIFILNKGVNAKLRLITVKDKEGKIEHDQQDKQLDQIA